MKYMDEYRDARVARGLAAEIRRDLIATDEFGQVTADQLQFFAESLEVD